MVKSVVYLWERVDIVVGQSRKLTEEICLPVVLVAEIIAGLLPEGFLGSFLSSFFGKCGCPPAPDKEHKIISNCC